MPNQYCTALFGPRSYWTLSVFLFFLFLLQSTAFAVDAPTCLLQDACNEDGTVKSEFAGTACGAQFELPCAQIGLQSFKDKFSLSERISGAAQTRSSKYRRQVLALTEYIRVRHREEVTCFKSGKKFVCKKK